MQQIGARLAVHLIPLQHVIVNTYLVDLKDRLRECAQCGSMDRAHQCAVDRGSRRPFVNPRAGAGRQQQSAAQGDRGASMLAANADVVSNNICLSWSRTKVCPRLQRGDRCKFQHPADFAIPPRSVCFEWRDTGACYRGDACKFARTHVPVKAASEVKDKHSEPRAAAAQVASASAPAASPRSRSSSHKKHAPSQAAAAEAKASEEAPFQTVPARKSSRRSSAASPMRAAAPPASVAPASGRKRKTNEAELSTPTQTPEQPVAAAAAAAAAHTPLASTPPALPPTPQSSGHWADMSDSDGESVTIKSAGARAAASSAAPRSSLDSLSSPRPVNSITPIPLHRSKHGRTDASASGNTAAASSSSSSSRSKGGTPVARTISFSPAGSSSQPAAASGSTLGRSSSDTGTTKPTSHQ